MARQGFGESAVGLAERRAKGPHLKLFVCKGVAAGAAIRARADIKEQS